METSSARDGSGRRPSSTLRPVDPFVHAVAGGQERRQIETPVVSLLLHQEEVIAGDVGHLRKAADGFEIHTRQGDVEGVDLLQEAAVGAVSPAGPGERAEHDPAAETHEQGKGQPRPPALTTHRSKPEPHDGHDYARTPSMVRQVVRSRPSVLITPAHYPAPTFP